MRGPGSHENTRRWMSRAALSASTVVLGLALGACQVSGPVAEPAIARPGIAEPGIAPDMIGMGCEQAQEFAFSGETTLAAIGLADQFGNGPDTQRLGMVWVTADAVNMNGPGPMPPGVEPMLDRMVCVLWPDGGSMGGSIPADWEPPGDPIAALAEESAGPPLTLIGLIVAAAVVIGVSYLAFREDRR